MNTVAFDGLVQELGSVSTRRSIFRLLGGVAAVGAGLAVTANDESMAKSRGKASRGRGRDNDAVSAQGKGKGKKVTICYQNQTRMVKKSKLGNYPGATPGACPVVNGGGNSGGNSGGNNGGGTQQVVACTDFILSGGPNQTDPIGIDDEGSIHHTQGNKFLLSDNNGMASEHSPIIFKGKIGDTLRVRAEDLGGCRSFSPLWVHCLGTGQKKQIFTGYRGAHCLYPKGEFLDTILTVEL